MVSRLLPLATTERNSSKRKKVEEKLLLFLCWLLFATFAGCVEFLFLRFGRFSIHSFIHSHSLAQLKNWSFESLVLTLSLSLSQPTNPTNTNYHALQVKTTFILLAIAAGIHNHCHCQGDSTSSAHNNKNLNNWITWWRRSSASSV